jgi:lysophospholipase L1-like esterase/outer membrane murein-binding lipoprotein Lpp
MGKYRELGTGLDRVFRNNLNGNFDDIGVDVDDLQSQVNQLVVSGDSSVEAAQARVEADGTANATLKARLDKKEAEFESQLAQRMTKEEVDTKVAQIVSGSPKGTYATLTALQTAFPTGTTGVYLVTADGKWYYWNGSAWTAGGTYQSTGIAAKSITKELLSTSYFEEKAKIRIDNNPYDFAPLKSDGTVTLTAQSKVAGTFSDANPSSPFVGEKEMKITLTADSSGNAFLAYDLSPDAVAKVNAIGYLHFGLWVNKADIAAMTDFSGVRTFFLGVFNDLGAFIDQVSHVHSNLYVGQTGMSGRFVIDAEYGDYLHVTVKLPSTGSTAYRILVGARYVATGSNYRLSIAKVILGDTFYYFNRYKNIYQGEYKTENPLFGKSIVYKGDSILNGSNDTSGRRGWTGRIRDKNNMTMTNSAVNGALISDKGAGYHCIANNISNLPATADYVIFEGGANDYFNRMPIGTISDGYAATLDKTTFCGAFESVCKQILQKYPGKKIGYIIVYKLLNSTADRTGQKEYFDKAREICEKWSIPYLDLWKTSGLDHNVNPQFFADNVHVNDLGYDVTFEKVEAWLRTL